MYKVGMQGLGERQQARRDRGREVTAGLKADFHPDSEGGAG